MLDFGDYQKPVIDWANLHTDFFSPQLFSAYALMNLVPGLGCGPIALSTIINDKHPLEILKYCRDLDPGRDPKLGTPAATMVRVLKDHGYRVEKVTVRDLVYATKAVTEPLQSTHLLLVAGMLAKGEASWFIYWNNTEWHSGLSRKCDNNILMNRMLTAYDAYVVVSEKTVQDNKIASSVSELLNSQVIQTAANTAQNTVAGTTPPIIDVNGDQVSPSPSPAQG